MLGTLLSFFAGNIIYPLIIPGLMAGAIAIIISVFIPTFLAQYKIPLLLGGIVAVLFFTFYGGKYSEESKHKLEVAELNAEIAIYKGKSIQVTHEVEIKYIDRVTEIEKIKVEYQNVYVDRFVTKEDDAKCTINTGFVRLHDSSAKGELPGTPSEIDASPSIFKLSDVSQTVNNNYLTFNQVRAQLIGLQEWVQRQKTLADSVQDSK